MASIESAQSTIFRHQPDTKSLTSGASSKKAEYTVFQDAESKKEPQESDVKVSARLLYCPDTNPSERGGGSRSLTELNWFGSGGMEGSQNSLTEIK